MARRYRVVYRDGGFVRFLGDIALGVASRHALDPFLSRLLLAGVERGEIVLVDKETGHVAVRRDVHSYRGRFWGNPHAPPSVERRQGVGTDRPSPPQRGARGDGAEDARGRAADAHEGGLDDGAP